MVLEIVVTLRTYLMGLEEMTYAPLLLFVISHCLLSLKIIYQSLKKRSSTSHP